jgi:hypothetical protein
MRRLVYIVVLGSMLLTCLSASTTVAKQQVLAPDPRFGLVDSFWLPAEAAELNIGWERILFYWREIQPSGPEDWNTLHVREEWLASANANGRSVVGLLKNTAPWASEDGTEAGVPRGLYLPMDDPGNLWANFVRLVARYYGARNVHHWIIWNEPEIRAGVYGYEFAGNLNDYYRLLKVAYTVMKEEDPEAVIHLAGLTWWHDQSYFRRLLELASQDPEAETNNYFFDVISLHIYFRSETVETIVAAVKELEASFGLEKPIWINETNAPPNQDPLWPVSRPSFDVDLNQQSWFVIQSLALGFASGAERIGIYKLLDVRLPPGGESFGILRPDLSRRPAFYAYKTAIAYLRNFSAVERQQFPNYYVVSFERPQGVTRIAWARTAMNVSLDLPALASSASLISPVGRSTTILSGDGSYPIELDGAICDGECLIGGPPVIIFEQGVRLDPQRPPAVISQGGGPQVIDRDNGQPRASQAVTVSSDSATTNPRGTPAVAPLATATTLPNGDDAALIASTAGTQVLTPSQAAPVSQPAEIADDQQTESGETQGDGLTGLWFLMAAGGLSAALLLAVNRLRAR